MSCKIDPCFLASQLGNKAESYIRIFTSSINLACSCGYDDGQVTSELIALSVSEAKFLGVVDDVLQFVWRRASRPRQDLIHICLG